MTQSKDTKCRFALEQHDVLLCLDHPGGVLHADDWHEASRGDQPMTCSVARGESTEATFDDKLFVHPTSNGVAIELHDDHFAPLLQLVREAKNDAVRKRGTEFGHGLYREIEYRLEQASRAKKGPQCNGCGQFHPVVDGKPHPRGFGFICVAPHEEEVPHRCGYWASRCSNVQRGEHGA